MTDNMKLFMDMNKQSLIVEGFRLTPDGKEPNNLQELKNSSFKYIFKNASSIVVTRKDLASNTNFKPDWDI